MVGISAGAGVYFLCFSTIV